MSISVMKATMFLVSKPVFVYGILGRVTAGIREMSIAMADWKNKLGFKRLPGGG
jgi:hypothetical protein